MAAGQIDAGSDEAYDGLASTRGVGRVTIHVQSRRVATVPVVEQIELDGHAVPDPLVAHPAAASSKSRRAVALDDEGHPVGHRNGPRLRLECERGREPPDA